MLKKLSIFLLSLTVIILAGCATHKMARETEIQESGVEPEVVQSESAVQEETVPKKEEEITEVEPAQQKEEEKAEIAQSLPINEQKETESIITVIEKLEECYKTNNFEQWLHFLTPAYKERYSNEENLRAEGWEAYDLESFFHLLVETRKKGDIRALKISRVEFVSPHKALVYVLLRDKEFPEPQHTFIMVGNTWLKGLKDEEE